MGALLRSLLSIAVFGLTVAGATVPSAAPTAAQSPHPGEARGPKQWAAVAPGRIEAVSREIRVTAPALGRIADVLVKPNDQVFAGEVLVRLDDDDARARLAVADAQVAMHQRARDEQATSRSAVARRKAEDAVADADRALAQQQAALDEAARQHRRQDGGDQPLDQARNALKQAKDRLAQEQTALQRLKADPDTPLPNRYEGELNVGRAQRAEAALAVEKMRVRAPISGTILQVNAKPGELASPSPEQPLVVMADLSALRVRAEIDERDLIHVKVGQAVVVHANAFPDREFAGTVAAVGKIVGQSVINARNQRKLTDVDVIEVLIDLAEPGPLTVGMQADVYFRPQQ